MNAASVTSIRVLPPPTVQRARRAAAAELHADAEHERADDHRRPCRRHQPCHRMAEQRARRQRREEQQHADAEHQHLRAQAGTAAVGDEHAPRGRKAECCVIQRHAEQRADHIERGLAAADRLREIDRAERDQKQGGDERLRIDIEAARKRCSEIGHDERCASV
jgi:hypothetical protein